MKALYSLNKRKEFLLFVILIFLSPTKHSLAQTWIYTDDWNIDGSATFRHDSSSVGPVEMCVTPDKTVITIVQEDQTHAERLIAVDTLGNYKWTRDIAGSFTLSMDYCYSLHAVSDNGCVYVHKRDYGTIADYDIYRLNASGGIKWAKNYSNLHTTPVREIVPTKYNTFLIIYSDSLVEVDDVGNVLRTRRPFDVNAYSISMIDSDFIVFSYSNLSRQNFTGSIKWSFQAHNCTPIYTDTRIFYFTNGINFWKSRTTDGGLIWGKPIPLTDISVCNDGGLIGCYGNLITRFDSSGNIIWSRQIPFPALGYRQIIENKPNSFVTGGGYRCAFMNYIYWPEDKGYSYFLTSLDSTGHGVIDSTDNFMIGNANHNSMYSFADDAPYVAAAIGSVGKRRLPVLASNQYNYARSAFATNWSERFCTGLNYKYSDIDGNGKIDTSDIGNLIEFYPPEMNIPANLRLASPNQSLPDIKLQFLEDTIVSGDSATICVILGSDLIPVDSLYSLGIVIYHYFDINSFSNSNAGYSIPVSSFGDPSTNLFSRYYFKDYYSNFVISRTDHMNATLSGDTIAYLRIPVNQNARGHESISFLFNAINKCGEQIPMNTVTDSIYVINILGINTYAISDIKIYPNPASDEIIFSIPEGINQLKIYDTTGREIYSNEKTNGNLKVNTSSYPDGIYYFTFKSEKNILRSKFTVTH